MPEYLATLFWFCSWPGQAITLTRPRRHALYTRFPLNSLGLCLMEGTEEGGWAKAL